MAVTQIDGAKQIKSASISTTQLSATAGITDGQLANSYLYANGTRAMTAALNLGGFKATNQLDGTADTDGATWGQVKSMVNGLDVKASVRLASTGSETYTIAAGAVTQITGTSLDGVALVIGNRVLIKNAPTTTGAGVPDTNATGSSN